jgi:intein/homing endonuclease
MTQTTNKLSDLVCHYIIGNETAREMVGLMLFMNPTEDKMHLCLVGDPGSSKSLEKNTIVTLANGLQKSIKDIVRGDAILSVNNDFSLESRKVLAKEPSHVSNSITIETVEGYSITSSLKHRFYTLSQDGHFQYVSAGNIKVGDYIASTALGSLLDRDNQPIKYQPTDERYTYKIKFPDHVIPQLASFLGYIIGDGHVNRTTIGFCNVDNELINHYKSLSLHIFNKKPKTDKRHIHHRLASTLLSEYILSLGIYDSKKKKIIPEVVMNSSNESISYFIRALFDCDGCTNKEGHVKITLNSKTLIYQIQHLLLRLGIYSKIRKTRGKATNSLNPITRTYYSLNIENYDNLRKYAQFIGFRHKQKMKRLRTYLNKERTQKSNALDYTPVSPYLISDMLHTFRCSTRKNRKYLNYSRFLNENQLVSRLALKKLTSTLIHRISELTELSIRDVSSWGELRKICWSSGISDTELAMYMHYSPALISQFGRGSITCLDSSKLDIATIIVRKIINDMLKHTPQVFHLARLANSPIKWSRITKIKRTKAKGEFYDIQVEGTERFIANNILSHNSALGDFAVAVMDDSSLAAKVTKNTTDVGLLGACDRDGMITGGVLRTNKGRLIIADELEKWESKTKRALLESMQERTVTITKGSMGIQKFPSIVNIIATSNPKKGRWYGLPRLDRVPIDDVLLTRFNAIIPFKDSPPDMYGDIGESFHTRRQIQILPELVERIDRGFEIGKVDLTAQQYRQAGELVGKLKAENEVFYNQITPRLIEGFVSLVKARGRFMGRQPIQDDFIYIYRLIQGIMECWLGRGK